MEGERNSRLLLTSNPSPLQGSPSSQTFPPLSSVPRGPPPPVATPSQECQWSNAAIKFLLAQCKEHVEAHNTVTMRRHQ